MTLTVTPIGPNNVNISWPKNHPKAAEIREMTSRLGPGYVEYWLQHNTDPHCSSCHDTECEQCGMGDDACAAFKFTGKVW